MGSLQLRADSAQREVEGEGRLGEVGEEGGGVVGGEEDGGVPAEQTEAVV